MKRILPLAVALTAGFIAGSKAGHRPYDRLSAAVRATVERSGLLEASNRVADATASSAGTAVDRPAEPESREQLAHAIRQHDDRADTSDPGALRGNPYAPVAGTVERAGQIRPVL